MPPHNDERHLTTPDGATQGGPASDAGGPDGLSGGREKPPEIRPPEAPPGRPTGGEVTGWFDKIALPDQSIEVRAFRGDGRVKSFVFGPEERGRMLAKAREQAAAGWTVYFTINPLKLGVSGSAGDADVDRRTLLFIDADPVRAEGCRKESASDAEKALARAAIVAVLHFLRGLGFPEPITCDSGNGYHLLYRVDLPNDCTFGPGKPDPKKPNQPPPTVRTAEGTSLPLVKRCLAALSHKFGSPSVEIDTTVCNAGRITKFYGTASRKGTSTNERPHRVSRVLEMPEGPLLAVPRELLETLAAMAPAGPPARDPEIEKRVKAIGRRGRGNEATKKYRALQWLKKAEGAISGHHGHNRFFKVVCGLFIGFDLDYETAYQLIVSEYNKRCDPEWSHREIEHKLNEAEKVEKRPRGWILAQGSKAYEASRGGRQDSRPAAAGVDVGAGIAGPTDAISEADDPIADRVQRIVQECGIAALYRDRAILAGLAILEVDDPGEMEAIKVGLQDVKGFTTKALHNAIKPHRVDGRAEFEPTAEAAEAAEYSEVDGRLVASLPNKDGSRQRVELCNFTARIESDVARDDGNGDIRRSMRISGVLNGEVLEAEVSAEDFESMEWVVAGFGPRAIVAAGRGIRDHLRAAIQNLSDGVTTTTIRVHTGWMRSGDRWVYVTSGGAIGEDGMDPSVKVELGDDLAGFSLPAPPEGVELVDAIRSTLNLLRFAQDDRDGSRMLTAVLVAAPVRAILGRTRYAICFRGLSGTHKSCTAALAQQHFGASMDDDNLPSGFNSTPNALMTLLNKTKDSILVVDDFTATGGTHDVAAKHQEAEMLIRSQANGVGRARLNSDGTSKPTKRPRGLLLTTGEDRFRTTSVNARTIAVEFCREDPAAGVQGTVDRTILTLCQADARNGLYASKSSAFIRWAASRYESLLERLNEGAKSFRPLLADSGAHSRSADIIGDLATAGAIFAEFAVECGAFTQAEADEFRLAVEGGLMDGIESMASDAKDHGDPCDIYFRCLDAALASTRAYLADHRTGGPPEGMESGCGWIRDSGHGDGDDRGSRWRPAANARRAGWWSEDGYIYLHPEVAYELACDFAIRQGENLPSKLELHRQLGKSGQLAKVEANGKKGGHRWTPRVTVEGQQRRALHISSDKLARRVGPGIDDEDGPEDGPEVLNEFPLAGGKDVA